MTTFAPDLPRVTGFAGTSFRVFDRATEEWRIHWETNWVMRWRRR